MINVESMNRIENTYEEGKTSVIDIKEMPYFDGEQYDLFDEKDYGKFIQDVERACRMSFEYRQLISYLKNTEGMSVCSFLHNVTNADNTKVRIEIHHSPLTLYDISSTVIKKRLHNKESINIFDVCNEVLWLHYIGWVGLIPLSETVHELVHNQYIFVPTDIVRGNYRQFIESYYDYIDPDVLDAIDNAENMTKEMRQIGYVDKQMNIFNLHQTYIRSQGNTQPKKDQAKVDIKQRIDEIKSNKKLMYRIVDESKR